MRHSTIPAVVAFLLLVLVVTAGSPARCETRRMAITIDDLPVAPPNRHTIEQQERITEKLLAVLAEHGVPVVGMVNESKLVDPATESAAADPRRVKLLERWLDAGQELGNHGYDHLDLHTVDPDEWMADVLRGERVIRPLIEGRHGTLRWFRHPFLHTGRTAEIQERTEAFLGEHGYRVAPVTVDNGEWIYGGAYADAWNRGDAAAMERLGDDYVRYMLEVVRFYEGQAEAILPPGEAGAMPQVLLIHAYALNADRLGELLDALEARGYEWISLEKALEHPAYSRPTHGYTGAGGITWLHRWAITEHAGEKEWDRSIFQGEPEVPGWVEAMQRGETMGAPPPPPLPAPAEPLAVPRTEVRRLTSRVNGVEYELRVALPHGYDDSEKRFPVVYTLDADYSFLIARGIVDHLSERDHLEEAIVVGIAYGGPLRYRWNRTRDYTPTHVPDGGYGPEVQEVSGGGPKFLEAIEREIVPFVDRSYRTLPGDRTLVGHSYGGLFTAWTLLTHPGLFADYVIVSPSIWYDDELLLRLEAESAAAGRALSGRVYLCAGSRENEVMPRDMRRLAERLEKRTTSGFAVASLVMEGETHNSIFPGCLSNGLRFVLNGV